MSINASEVKRIHIGDLCYESSPCQHDCKIELMNGREIQTRLDAVQIQRYLDCAPEIISNFGREHFGPRHPDNFCVPPPTERRSIIIQPSAVTKTEKKDESCYSACISLIHSCVQRIIEFVKRMFDALTTFFSTWCCCPKKPTQSHNENRHSGLSIPQRIG